MDTDGGGYPLELQAKTVVDGIMNGSRPCPTCGIIMNPIQVMNRLLCPTCHEKKMANRVVKRMV